MNKITFPIGYYPDPTKGKPISGGSIYIGEPDTDPTVPANQKDIYALRECGLPLIQISQPVSLSAGGVPLYNGSPIVLFVAGNYSMSVRDSLGSQTYYISDNSLNDSSEFRTFDTVADMTSATLSVGVSYKTLGYFTVGDGGGAEYIIKTAAEYGATPDGKGDHTVNTDDVAVLQTYGTINVQWFGAKNDGTDATTEVISAAKYGNARSVIFIPQNVKYDFNTVMDSVDVPVETVFRDESLINGGYLKDKLLGFYEKGDGTSETDTTYVISSGHNTGLALDNTGKSGSASGDKRISVLAWTGGRTQKGALDGVIRSISRLEFSQSASDSDRWNMVLRKRAPFEAVDADYWRWATGVTTAIDEYCFSDNKYYKATSAGTTGATAPTHTTGTVSDGGVDWLYIDFSYDASVFIVDDFGRIATNGAINNFMRLRQSADDTNPYVIAYEPVGNSKTVTLRASPTDGSGVAQDPPDLIFNENDLNFFAGSATVASINGDGFDQRTLVKTTSTVSGATPSVAGKHAVYLDNSVATDVTDFIDYVSNQEIQVIAANGNSTLKQGTNLRLTGGVDILLTALSIVTLRRTSLTSGWVEVSRSIK